MVKKTSGGQSRIDKTLITDNYRKHNPRNPLQKYLIENFFKTFINTVKFSQVDSVLDVGCGEGFTMKRLKKAKIGKTIEGLEYLDKAIEIGKKLHPDLKITQGDIYKLPYKANSFDLVICTEVLEHLEYPKKALRELVRISKKYVLLSVPNEPWFRLGNFLRGKNLSRWGNDMEHIQHWSTDSFAKFVNIKGVKIIEKKRPLPWTIILLKKIK
ncbi:MAG: class I SAM-dependent methyltransferase [Candidatus Levybacteria bacterium]|nr:class I SAM-dependent methyltransferase [Candidatus Levybacteria bacterium]MBI4097473.1 class I SAM-dependent methyltransferase [Candidatus Levybacteria bacterium]